MGDIRWRIGVTRDALDHVTLASGITREMLDRVALVRKAWREDDSTTLMLKLSSTASL